MEGRENIKISYEIVSCSLKLKESLNRFIWPSKVVLYLNNITVVLDMVIRTCVFILMVLTYSKILAGQFRKT